MTRQRSSLGETASSDLARLQQSSGLKTGEVLFGLYKVEENLTLETEEPSFTPHSVANAFHPPACQTLLPKTAQNLCGIF